MRKILIELQVNWEGYEDVSDELIVEDAIQEKVEGVGWTLLRQPPVSGELADFARFLSEEYSIEIHERIIDEWNKYYSANYR